jgi:hypothetical protein
MMKDTNITCPKCGAEIALSEAVSHQLREQLRADFDKEREKLNDALATREKQLQSEKQQLEQRQQSLRDEIDRQINVERKKLVQEAARQAEDKLGIQLKDVQSQLEDQREKLKQARTTELDLRKKQRELEEAKENLQLEVARQLDLERAKIAEQARQHAVEGEHLKLADKDNVIKGLQGQIAALQQRAEQGSTQLQGETLELELEGMLAAAFPSDEIVEVKKGQRGADVAQRVRTSTGLDCGAILWEAKRAKHWSGDWPAKLKDDQREAKADLAVIITTCLPPDVRGITQLEGIWVSEPAFAVALAGALRQGLVSTATHRLQDTDRADKMSLLYDYLCGVEFRQRIQAIVDCFIGLQDQLTAEKRAFAKQWKEREQQLTQAVAHTAMLYGSIQGIAGRQALPEIRTLQIPGSASDATTKAVTEIV